MDWRFGLKIRESFTVSAFSLTVWQTLLHILINVNWNKSGFIQTDATHNIIVNSSLACLITESITIYSYIYIFNATKCIVYISSDKKVSIILFILDFKIGNGRQSKRLLDNMGWIFLFLCFSLLMLRCCMKTRYRTGNFWM